MNVPGVAQLRRVKLEPDPGCALATRAPRLRRASVSSSEGQNRLSPKGSVIRLLTRIGGPSV